MNDDPVVVGNYPDSLAANLARQELESAGILARLGDDAVADMIWSYTTAIGGVKLLVRQSDAMRAREVLANSNELADDYEADSEEIAHVGEEPDDEDPPLTAREEMARRALRGATLGILFAPLLLYVAWMLVSIAASDERLLPQYRRDDLVATAPVRSRIAEAYNVDRSDCVK